jgi:hypothetical protein
LWGGTRPPRGDQDRKSLAALAGLGVVVVGGRAVGTIGWRFAGLSAAIVAAGHGRFGSCWFGTGGFNVAASLGDTEQVSLLRHLGGDNVARHMIAGRRRVGSLHQLFGRRLRRSRHEINGHGYYS